MSIFIPNKINVGYQNREGTYTGKLAYVIYYEERGKLRKETSWQNWRDENIPNNIYENVPTDGFVLNKKVGDYVEKEEEILKIYVDKKDMEIRRILSCFTIEDEKKDKEPLVYGVIM